jgi:glycosyltransferase involved in cell wall biosynthesis
MGIVEPARNFGIELARHEWILLVDADERFPPELVRYLSRESTRDDACAFAIPFRHWICGAFLAGTGWGITRHVRFFRRGAVDWPSRVHGLPAVTGSITDVPFRDDLCVDHLNYRDFSHFLVKMDRYTDREPERLDDVSADMSWERAVEDARREVIERWQPGVDGTRSAALALAMMAYRLFGHLKRWERDGWPVIPDLPESPADALLTFAGPADRRDH